MLPNSRAMDTIARQRGHRRGTSARTARLGPMALLAVLPLLWSGCASFPRLSRPPLEPPASETEALERAGEPRLYSATRLPKTEPLGVIFFVVGPEVGSTEPYPTFSEAALAAGFALAVVHPRGTGYSEGLRGDLEDFRPFLADLTQGLDRLRQRFPSKPIFLFGQSAGAALALEVAASSRTRLAGLVLVNPAYKLRASEGMTPSLGDYLRFGFNAVFRPTALTVDMNSKPSAIAEASDRADAEAMQRDPLVVRYFSMRFLSAQKQVMDRCAANAAATDAPLLLIQGARDALVEPAGNDEILAAARTSDKVKRIAPEGGHGSSAVETMVGELLGWLQAHGAP